jgi:hypothetical protein
VLSERLVLSVLALAAGAVLSGCGGGASGAPGSADSVVVASGTDDVTGRSATVIVPTGRLDITVGTPLDGSVDADQALDDEDHSAPDGMTYVPLEWDFDTATPMPGVGIIGQQAQPTKVVVTSGGTSTPLPAPYHTDGKVIGFAADRIVYVPVEDPDAITVEATYDGLTQTLDVATGKVDQGAAAPLYGDASAAKQDLDCGDGTVVKGDGSSATLVCEATLERVPYYPGTGWAKDGRAFDVLGWSVSGSRFTDPNGDPKSVDEVTATGTVEGGTSLGALPVTIGSAEGNGRKIEVFDAPASGGSATIDYTLLPSSASPLPGTIALTLP